MKKSFFWSLLTFAMVAMLSVGLASCGDDDDDNGGGGSNQLIGLWKQTYRHEVGYNKDSSGNWNKFYEEGDSYDDDEESYGLLFQSNGQAKVIDYLSANGKYDDEDAEDFKYKVQDGHLYMLELDDADTDGWEDWGKFTISGKIVEFSYEDYDGSNYKYVGTAKYKKIK